jgi:hypothetical protein
LDKDTGYQGYEPAGVITFQSKKSQRMVNFLQKKNLSTGFFQASVLL